MSLAERYAGWVIFIVLVFVAGLFAGYNWPGKVCETLTPSEIADNIEYIAFNVDYPFAGFINDIKIGELRNKYELYNMKDGTHQSRQLLEIAANRVCNTRIEKTGDWYRNVTTTSNVSIDKFMECIQKNEIS